MGGALVDKRQRQAVGLRAFSADIGIRLGLGRNGNVVPFAGNGRGRGVARGGAGGQALRQRLRQASAGGEAVLCGGRLNGAAVRSGNGRLNGAGAAGQGTPAACRACVAAVHLCGGGGLRVGAGGEALLRGGRLNGAQR